VLRCAALRCAALCRAPPAQPAGAPGATALSFSSGVRRSGTCPPPPPSPLFLFLFWNPPKTNARAQVLRRWEEELSRAAGVFPPRGGASSARERASSGAVHALPSEEFVPELQLRGWPVARLRATTLPQHACIQLYLERMRMPGVADNTSTVC
jgi:hypothetical protein